MVRVFAIGVFVLVLLAPPAAAPPVVDCPCDHGRSESLEARVCSLCGTAEKQTTEVYFLKDINPNKPNRYLALPKAHERGMQSVGTIPKPLRTQLWREAIAKAQELFGERWGIAHNSHLFRTQCHAHLHMGPMSPEVDDTNGTLYGDAGEFPAFPADQGMWVHPKDGRLCVHLDRDLTEIVLIR
jgi:diadenosine tetraphosphate (Ap4A) HIT family hydrolase